MTTPVLIARFSIGTATDDADLGGSVCVRHAGERLFSVFVDGGLLPDGSTFAEFANARLAFAFAATVVAEIAAEYVDFVDGDGVHP